MRGIGFVFLSVAACGGASPSAAKSDPIVVPSATPAASASVREGVREAAEIPKAATASAPKPPGGTPAFDALARALSSTEGWDPRRATLASYREEDGRIRIEVRARAEADVTEVAKRLQASRAFDRLTVGPESRSKDGGVSAEITAVARERAGDLVLASAAQASAVLDPAARNPFDPMTTEPDPPAMLDADVDAVHLLGIVTGAEPRALFSTRSGAAWIGKTGDRVGTSACRYRIDAIRATELALVKIDPAACPDRPAARTLALKRK